MWHEHSRADRQRYVRLYLENCIAGYEHNFLRHITPGDDVGEYDYGSIRQCPAFAFWCNTKPAIEPL
ncbi:MAG TPA: M12 family metallopeptidase [Pirellulales bacterium]